VRPVRRARKRHQSRSNEVSRRATTEQEPTATGPQRFAGIHRMTTATIEIEMTRYRRAPNFKMLSVRAPTFVGPKRVKSSS